MARQNISADLSATENIRRANGNFSELNTGNASLRTLSKDKSASELASDANTNFQTLFGSASGRVVISKDVSASTFAGNMNTNFEALYDGGSEPAEKPTLNILIFGNSYTQASFGYMPWILESLGIFCRFGMTYYSGATVAQYNEGYVDGFNPTWYYYETEGNRWYGGGSGKKPQKCVTYPIDNNKGWYWDIIVLNQASGSSYSSSTSGWGVGELMEQISSDIPVGSDTVFAWNINHSNNNGGSENSMTSEELLAKRRQILHNAREVCVNYDIGYVFCNGLAIFNAQTNEILDAIGDTLHLRADNSHLQNGLPKFIAAYANTLSLLDQFYSSRFGAENIQIPSVFYDGNAHGLAQHGTQTGVLDGNGDIITANVSLAKKAALFAAQSAKSFFDDGWEQTAITSMAGLTS